MSSVRETGASVTRWTTWRLRRNPRHDFTNSTLDPLGRGRVSRTGVVTATEGGEMSDRTYRVIDVVGTSGERLDREIRNAVRRAARTMRLLDWFEGAEIRGDIADGDVAHFQVGLKVGFRLEDPD